MLNFWEVSVLILVILIACYKESIKMLYKIIIGLKNANLLIQN